MGLNFCLQKGRKKLRVPIRHLFKIEDQPVFVSSALNACQAIDIFLEGDPGNEKKPPTRQNATVHSVLPVASHVMCLV